MPRTANAGASSTSAPARARARSSARVAGWHFGKPRWSDRHDKRPPSARRVGRVRRTWNTPSTRWRPRAETETPMAPKSSAAALTEKNVHHQADLVPAGWTDTSTASDAHRITARPEPCRNRGPGSSSRRPCLAAACSLHRREVLLVRLLELRNARRHLTALAGGVPPYAPSERKLQATPPDPTKLQRIHPARRRERIGPIAAQRRP